MQHTDKQKVLFLAKQEALEQGFEGAAAEAFVTAFIKNFEKGEKIGIEKGKAEERAKADAERMKMIKNMIEAGLSVEQVSKISGLHIDEIKKLTNLNS